MKKRRRWTKHTERNYFPIYWRVNSISLFLQLISYMCCSFLFFFSSEFYCIMKNFIFQSKKYIVYKTVYFFYIYIYKLNAGLYSKLFVLLYFIIRYTKFWLKIVFYLSIYAHHTENAATIPYLSIIHRVTATIYKTPYINYLLC